ncbi:MAG TPA: hypothetical protein PLW77_04170 [Bacteroidales bacterium]|nr:hypothetical protein [Bacteroidales bacterium]
MKILLLGKKQRIYLLKYISCLKKVKIKELDKISDDDFELIFAMCEETSKIISGLIKSIEKSQN